jgi:hypothetical protein
MVLSMSIVHKMLSTETLAAFDCLKEIGLGSRLAIIFDSPVSHSSIIVTRILLLTLERYLEQEVSFYDNSEVCSVNGIHI